MFSKETYIERRNRLRQSVKSGIILLLGNSEQPANYRSNTFHFRQDSNFLYYFGLNVADFAGIIDIEAGTECIYGDDYTVDDIVWMGP
jgi:Xaa-Pro aminopeptidase